MTVAELRKVLAKLEGCEDRKVYRWNFEMGEYEEIESATIEEDGIVCLWGE